MGGKHFQPEKTKACLRRQKCSLRVPWNYLFLTGSLLFAVTVSCCFSALLFVSNWHFFLWLVMPFHSQIDYLGGEAMLQEFVEQLLWLENVVQVGWTRCYSDYMIGAIGNFPSIANSRCRQLELDWNHDGGKGLKPSLLLSQSGSRSHADAINIESNNIQAQPHNQNIF